MIYSYFINRDCFFRYFRMSPAVFEELLCLVAAHISKKDTKLRQLISSSQHLCVTLRYFVTRHAFVTICPNYRISPLAISQIISKTCNCTAETFAREQIYCCTKTEKQLLWNQRWVLQKLEFPKPSWRN